MEIFYYTYFLAAGDGDGSGEGYILDAGAGHGKGHGEGMGNGNGFTFSDWRLTRNKDDDIYYARTYYDTANFLDAGDGLGNGIT